MSYRSCLYAFLLLLAFQFTNIKATIILPPPQCRPVAASSLERIVFFLNMVIYKAELFLRSSVGLGINDVSPGTVRGPAPIGATVANLNSATRRVIEEFGLSTVGHIREIVSTTRLSVPLPRPQFNVSEQLFSNLINAALNVSTLTPPFNVYANTTNFLFLAVYTSYLLKQYYTGIIPLIVGDAQQQLVARIALNEAAEYGVLRAQLNSEVNSIVSPYTFTVGNLTNLLAQLGNQLGGCGVKDEGLIVPLELGAENRTTSNVIAADANSLALPRFEREVLRILSGSGDATSLSGIFPSGFNGTLYRRIRTLRLS